MLEGFWYYSMGIVNCGTQMKLSAVLSGVLFCILAFRYIEADSTRTLPVLVTFGDYSFGIYFSHMLIITLLAMIPGYTKYVIYPFNAIVVIILNLGIVMAGRVILGRFAKYIAF